MKISWSHCEYTLQGFVAFISFITRILTWDSSWQLSHLDSFPFLFHSNLHTGADQFARKVNVYKIVFFTVFKCLWRLLSMWHPLFLAFSKLVSILWPVSLSQPCLQWPHCILSFSWGVPRNSVRLCTYFVFSVSFKATPEHVPSVFSHRPGHGTWLLW